MLPVVISADLIIAGDQLGWNDLTYPAAPDTCGQDIDVPEIILNCNSLLSAWVSEGGEIGDQLARMLTPGAIKSGWNIKPNK